MPIYDFAETGEITKPTRNRVVHLGSGDVTIAHSDDSTELQFLPENEAGPIGDFVDWLDGKTTADYPGCVRIAFDRLESLDVLIERAQALRAEMVARQEADPTP